MKNITISIDDEVYRAASEEAARMRKSLSELVQDFLTRLRTVQEPNGNPAQAAPELLVVAENLPGSTQSVSETALDSDRAALLEQLHRLVEEAREHDRDKKGLLVLGARKEWYAGFDQAALGSHPTAEEDEEARKKSREEFIQFLDELDARPLKDGPSVGPLNREELYQRGISGY